MSGEFGHPPSDTLRGLLARGRGAGVLLAKELGASSAREDLLWCVLNDPRWEPCEERALYYADLLIELHVDIAPILANVTPIDPDESLPLVAAVTAELTARGNEEAARCWQDNGGLEHDAELEAFRRSSAEGEEARHEVRLQTIREHRDMDERTLVSSFHEGDHDHRFFAALELGRRQSMSIFGDVVAMFGGERPLPARRTVTALLRYWEQLDPEFTLSLSRAWTDEPWPRGVAAFAALTRHAERSDVDMLIERGERALAVHVHDRKNQEGYVLSSVLEALGPLEDPGIEAFARKVFAEARYSYARGRAAECLIGLESRGAQALLRECIWDSEDRTRELGLLHANADDSVFRSRARHLAADGRESWQVRSAAGRFL